jgi:hypothetical protein
MLRRLIVLLGLFGVTILGGSVMLLLRSHDLYVFNGTRQAQHVVIAKEAFDAPPGLSKRKVAKSERTTVEIDGTPSQIFTDTGMESGTFVLDASTDVGYVLLDLSSFYTRKNKRLASVDAALDGISVSQASGAGQIQHAFAEFRVTSGPGELLPKSVEVGSEGDVRVVKLFRVRGEWAENPALLVKEVRRALQTGRLLTSVETLGEGVRDSTNGALADFTAVIQGVSVEATSKGGHHLVTVSWVATIEGSAAGITLDSSCRVNGQTQKASNVVPAGAGASMSMTVTLPPLKGKPRWCELAFSSGLPDHASKWVDRHCWRGDSEPPSPGRCAD